MYMLVNKSKVYEKFLLFKAMVETQFSTKIKVLRSDVGRGGGGSILQRLLSLFCHQMELCTRLHVFIRHDIMV